MLVSRITTAVCSALIAFTCLSAYAGDEQDVQLLIQARQFPQALARADQALAKTPKDAQLRFLRGIALTELGRNDEAIKVFSKLAEDYPHLPEPYNNLAVLYANTNQLTKARAALQMAIQTNPSYATAHENLGDLYARLAAQAYDKALQLDNTTQVQTKLKLVNTLNNAGVAPVRIAVATTTPVKAVATPVATKPSAVVTTVITPIKTTPIVIAALTPTPSKAVATRVPSATPTATPTPTPPKATPTPTAAPEAPRSSERQQIMASVEDWASAWSRQNVSGYVNSYAKGFKAPGGRSAWEKDRQIKISAPKSIKVQISHLKIDFIDDDTAKVRLRQSYQSDRLSSNTGKTLILQKAGSRWLILEERIGG